MLYMKEVRLSELDPPNRSRATIKKSNAPGVTPGYKQNASLNVNILQLYFCDLGRFLLLLDTLPFDGRRANDRKSCHDRSH